MKPCFEEVKKGACKHLPRYTKSVIGGAKIYPDMPKVKYELQKSTPICQKCDTGCKSIPRHAKRVIGVAKIQGVFF